RRTTSLCAWAGDQARRHTFPTRRSSDLLQDLEEVVPRVARLRDRLVVIAAELALHDAVHLLGALHFAQVDAELGETDALRAVHADRKSTRLNSSHDQISYAGFCLRKKTH